MNDLEKKANAAMFLFDLQKLKYCVYEKFEGMQWHVLAGFTDLNTAIQFTESHIEKSISKDYRKKFSMLVRSEAEIFLDEEYP